MDNMDCGSHLYSAHVVYFILLLQMLSLFSGVSKLLAEKHASRASDCHGVGPAIAIRQTLLYHNVCGAQTKTSSFRNVFEVVPLPKPTDQETASFSFMFLGLRGPSGWSAATLDFALKISKKGPYLEKILCLPWNPYESTRVRVWCG